MSYNALNPPPLVRDKPANEVMRVAVHNGELHMSMRRGFDDPGMWGLLFVDAARNDGPGLKVRQEMRLQGSGRTLSNHVVVRKFGLKFASVDGTIRKLD